MFSMVNCIYSLVGIRFELQGNLNVRIPDLDRARVRVTGPSASSLTMCGLIVAIQ